MKKPTLAARALHLLRGIKTLARRALAAVAPAQPKPAPVPRFGSARAARRAEKKSEGLRLAVVRGRIEFADRTKLVGAKGLR